MLAASLAGCSYSGWQVASPTVATVGGQPISQALLDHYVQVKTGVTPEKIDAAYRQALLEDLKRLEAAAQVAAISMDPQTEQELALQRLQFLARTAAMSAGVYASPTDGELKDEYERFKSTLPASEFHVAHILVATDNAATVLIEKLQSGADFAKLAREQSADESRAKGGDLGWIAPGKLPVAFTDAVRALKPGQYTRHPMQTPYGWHVIKLLETRAAQVPPFEQVKTQLAVNLHEARYRKFLEASLAAADHKS